MSSRSQNHPGPSGVVLLTLFAVLCIFTNPAAAQDKTPKWEIFGGYSFVYPNTDLHVQNPGAALPFDMRLESNPRGVGASITYDWNRWLGFTVDGSGHWGSGEVGLTRFDDAAFYNLSLGPKVTLRSKHFSPFIEALVGVHRLTPDALHHSDKVGFLGGGGLDVVLTRHLALRVIRADYAASDHRFQQNVPSTRMRGVRLQSGVVWMFGGANEAPLAATATCNVNPNNVLSGEPVQATASVSNFPKNKRVTYNWSSTGGKVSGNEATTTVDTTGMAAGSYTVTAKATDNKKTNAECTSNFTVNVKQAENPPTMSCSANPTTVRSGDSSAITCNCTSPDNRTVTISNWTASSGRISGSGGNATLDTAGASPGAINVAASCSDDRGLNAQQGNTIVNVEAPPPPPPPPPQASKINEIEFPNPVKPWRVDNTAKAILDDVALRLQREPDSRAVVIGSTEQGEARAAGLSAERAVDAKAYLTQEKGIDPSRLEVRSGGTAGRKAEIWIIPAGSGYTGSEAPVNENKVKAIPDHPAARGGVKK